MGLAWAAATAERDDGGVGVGQFVLGLGRLSPSRVSVGVGTAVAALTWRGYCCSGSGVAWRG